MSTVTLEVTQDDTEALTIVAAPPYGNRIVLQVHPAFSTGGGCLVTLGREGDRVVSSHRNFGIASRSALHRAKRYVRAYSKPHGLQVAK
jgi:hypothetical protein